MYRFARMLSVGLFCLAAGQSPAAATLVTLQISGVVDQVVDDSGLLSQPVTAGMSFSGLLVYDTDVADAVPGDTDSGEYNQPPPASLSIDVGGNHFETAPGSTFQISIDIDPGSFPVTGDIISLLAIGQTKLTNLDDLQMAMALQDTTGAALDTDSLPSNIDASLFDNRWIQLYGFDYQPEFGTKSFQIRLRPDSFTAVPDPSTFALAGIGGLALLACGMRRRNQSSH